VQGIGGSEATGTLAGEGGADPSGRTCSAGPPHEPIEDTFDTSCSTPSRRQPRHGYEIIQAIEERSGGSLQAEPRRRLPHASDCLEELRHARLEEKDDRKVYAITPEGKKDLDEHARRS
jgi:hypothetical protein